MYKYTSWWWATNMPETCRGWWRNKLRINIASSWFFYYIKSKKSIFVLVSCRVMFFLFCVIAEKWATSLSAVSTNCRHVITLILYTTVDGVIIIFPANITVNVFLLWGEWFSCCRHNYRKLYELGIKKHKLSWFRWMNQDVLCRSGQLLG